jgi:carbon monoxide dehydrogenase subunit G
VIKARGQAPGNAVDAIGTMNLLDGDEPGTTQMLWAADVQISGMIASVGARLVNSTADKLIKQTFDCIRAKLEG